MTEIDNIIAYLEKITRERIVSTNYARKSIKNAFSIFIEKYSFKEELIKAAKYINHWEQQFSKDVEKRDAIFSNIEKELDDIVSVSRKNFKNIKKGKEINTKYDDWEVPEEWRLVTDPESFEELISGSIIVDELYLIQRKAKREIIYTKIKFHSLLIAFRLFSAVVYLLAVIIAYYIGLLCEYYFLFNPILVAIISAILCLYTSDYWLEKIKEKTFWNHVEYLIEHIKSKYLNFRLIELQFINFKEKHPELLK